MLLVFRGFSIAVKYGLFPHRFVVGLTLIFFFVFGFFWHTGITFQLNRSNWSIHRFPLYGCFAYWCYRLTKIRQALHHFVSHGIRFFFIVIMRTPDIEFGLNATIPGILAGKKRTASGICSLRPV